MFGKMFYIWVLNELLRIEKVNPLRVKKQSLSEDKDHFLNLQKFSTEEKSSVLQLSL